MSFELKIIGMVLILFASYLGYQYRHNDFKYELFEKWKINYLKRFPDAENDEAEEFFRTQQGAPIDVWLKGEYLKRLDKGKKLALILGGIGAFLTILG